ncbi:MAG: class I SAM-dependent methyltransferase [Beijerinckiaceae bacterium]|nr:class I SAM-dependent methyltransferase [Beijerinckiaceae bacterium]MCI0736081.1 class I SAM-dependent methyltransferase [Beijerinckiaceae bacterium]
MSRIPETEELMDTPLHALAYAKADFTEPNSKFVALFSDKFPAFRGQKILDLGCGPADITIRLALRYPWAGVVGLDGADAMLDIARKTIVRHASLASRLHVRRWHIGKEANPLGAQQFDAVVSNSLLHHMRDPIDLWKAVRSCAAPGAAVLVMDLIRPKSRVEAEKLVEAYAGQEPEVLRGDFLASLLAAYRPPEIAAQLNATNMNSLRTEVVSDRHFIVFGSIDKS